MDANIDFSNPGHLKLALLSHGLHIKSREVFDTTVFAENQFPYGYSSEEIKKYNRIPAELVLDEEIYCGIHIRTNSPWHLSIKNKHIMLVYNDTPIRPISFIPRPSFYGKRLTNGELCEKVTVLYGNQHVLSYFTRGYCYFFSLHKECKFCSLNPTRNSYGKKNVRAINPKIAKESAALAFQSDNNLLYVNHCAGTFSDNNIGLTLQTEILKSIVEVAPSHIKHHMLTMPPDDLRLLHDLKKSGLQTINFALEVYDKKMFTTICSGKATLYGRDKFFEAFKEAVQVFGKGNVYCNFVGGLEKLETLTEGFDYLASIGVAPSVNVFHPDPKSKFFDWKPPTVAYLLNMAKKQKAIYKENNFKPIYPIGGTRNSTDTEVWKGLFN